MAPGHRSSAAMSQSRRTVAKPQDLLPSVRRQSSWFNVAAVTRNVETLFERMYRRYRAVLPQEDLMVEHRAPALPAASSAELS